MNDSLPRPSARRGRLLAVACVALVTVLSGCTVSGPPTEATSTTSTDDANTLQGTTGADPISAADKAAWMATVGSMQSSDDDVLYKGTAALWKGTAPAPFEETKKLEAPVAKYSITLMCAGRGSAIATVRFGNQEVVTTPLDCTPSHSKATTTISTTKDADSLTVKMKPEGSPTVVAGVIVARTGSATSADEVDRSPVVTSTTTSKQPSPSTTSSKPSGKPSVSTTRPRPTFTMPYPGPPTFPRPTRYPTTWPPPTEEDRTQQRP